MLKYFFLIFILIFFSAQISSLLAKESSVDLEQLKQDNEAQKQKDNSYKISREQDNLSCLKPLTIKGLDTLLIVNKKGEVVYEVNIIGFEGTCQWERDRLLFTKKTDVQYAQQQVDKFTGNMYLSTEVRLLFNVRKLQNDTLPFKSFKLPYFIILHDKKTDKIELTKNLVLNVKLNQKEKTTLLGQSINFTLTVPEKEVINKELLSGMYLKTKVINKSLEK